MRVLRTGHVKGGVLPMLRDNTQPEKIFDHSASNNITPASGSSACKSRLRSATSILFVFHQ